MSQKLTLSDFYEIYCDPDLPEEWAYFIDEDGDKVALLIDDWVDDPSLFTMIADMGRPLFVPTSFMMDLEANIESTGGVH